MAISEIMVQEKISDLILSAEFSITMSGVKQNAHTTDTYTPPLLIKAPCHHACPDALSRGPSPGVFLTGRVELIFSPRSGA